MGKKIDILKILYSQEEFIGLHLRFNCFGNNFTVYPFDISNGFTVDISNYILLKVVDKLKRVIDGLQLGKWLVKFDVVLENEDSWVALDIGLDPPFRMLKYYNDHNLNFYKFYVEQCIYK